MKTRKEKESDFLDEGDDFWGRRRPNAGENEGDEGDVEDSPRKDKDTVEGFMMLQKSLENALWSFDHIVYGIQQEVLRVVAESNNSEKTLFRMVGGEPPWLLRGKKRALVTRDAIASACNIETKDGSCGEIIGSVAVIELHPGGDKFSVELVQMKEILTKTKIQVFLDAGLIDEEMYRDMWHGIQMDQIGVQRIHKGNIIENKDFHLHLSNSATATERLAESCFGTTSRLPIGVKRAKVIKVSGNELRWECLENPLRWGWVLRRGVRIAMTTREVDSGDVDWDAFLP